MDEPRPVLSQLNDSDSEQTISPEPCLPQEGVPEPGPASASPLRARELFDVLLTPANLVLLGAAGVLGLFGLLGGWDRVGEKDAELVQVSAKQTTTAAPFKLTFDRAYWYTHIKGLPSQDDGYRALMVIVDVTNTSREPLGLREASRAFRLQVGGLKGDRNSLTSEQIAPNLYRGSDLLPMRTLQPGLLTRLVLIWSQSKTEPLPRELKITAYRQTFRTSSLEDGKAYFDPESKAVATLPLKEFKVP